MKLHLGCGEKYLDGYLNIDLPSAQQTVIKSRADRYEDLKNLRFKKASIEEVRLHHVFEHFSRATACAFLASWYSWLTVGGKIRIEVPDFNRSALVLINPFVGVKKKSIALRHIFGSGEADWANHLMGYTTKSMRSLLEAYGFTVTKISKNNWRGTYNFEIIAEKLEDILNKSDFFKITYCNLSQFLVDQSELKLLDVWMAEYEKQMNLSFTD